MKAAALSLLLILGAFASNPGDARAEGGATPSWWDSPRRIESDRSRFPEGEGPVAVIGRLSATPEAAERDVRRALGAAIVRWLEPEVPAGWEPPASLVSQAIRESHIRATKNEHAAEPAFEEFPELYRGGFLAELGAPQRARFLAAHRQEVVSGRLWGLGLGLGFALICLGTLAGYIRADESTRGYFTWPLRIIATAAVAGAGAAAYWLG